MNKSKETLSYSEQQVIDRSWRRHQSAAVGCQRLHRKRGKAHNPIPRLHESSLEALAHFPGEKVTEGVDGLLRGEFNINLLMIVVALGVAGIGA